MIPTGEVEDSVQQESDMGHRGHDRSRLSLVHGYIAREFLISFIVAFLFFFFIFFINQILLYAQRILLKQVPVRDMFTLVALSMPQILLYTIPFSTLSGASMVIGNLSSHNEIIAFRAIGISLSQMFRAIIIGACFLSILTFIIADALLPVSHLQFKRLYTELLRTLPTMELQPYSVNEVGDVVIVTQEVSEGYVNNPLLFTTDNSGEQITISAADGSLELIDTRKFIYRLDLNDVQILSSNASNPDDYRLGNGESLSYYLDFSGEVEQVRNVTPSQMSTRDLLAKIATRVKDRDKAIEEHDNKIAKLDEQIVQLEQSVIDGSAGADAEAEIETLQQEKDTLESHVPINFYLQYYRAELHKKFALSASALILTLITFPLSFVKIRHGRLFGFGLSLLVAAFYWAMLFVAQTQIIKTSMHPLFLMWAPNAVILLISTTLLLRLRRV